jgi:hypothetical protein
MRLIGVSLADVGSSEWVKKCGQIAISEASWVYILLYKY